MAEPFNPENRTPRYCRICGQPLKPESGYCGTCGARIAAAEPSPEGAPCPENAAPAKENRRNPKAGLIAAIVSVCVIAAAAGSFALYRALAKPQSASVQASALLSATLAPAAPRVAPGDPALSGRIGCALSALGVKDDGTVLSTLSTYPEVKYNRSDISGWADIRAVSASIRFAAGLKKDGTVVAVGDNQGGECDVSGWTDIQAIATGESYTLGLKKDGTVIATPGSECDVSGWTDITAISSGLAHAVGLKKDGTVVAVKGFLGKWDVGQTDVSGWTDIIAVATGVTQTYGLKKDGTVVATVITDPKLDYGQGNVQGWKGIVAISANLSETVGLKADGTVEVSSNDPEFLEARNWTDIVAVYAGMDTVIGLKADGTVVATPIVDAKSDFGQTAVEDWNLFGK